LGQLALAAEKAKDSACGFFQTIKFTEKGVTVMAAMGLHEQIIAFR